MKDALFVEWRDLWNMETHIKKSIICLWETIARWIAEMLKIAVDKGHENK